MKKNYLSYSKNKGFTLIELVFAMFIAIIVMSLMHDFLKIGFETLKKFEDETPEIKQEILYNIIQRDCINEYKVNNLKRGFEIIRKNNKDIRYIYSCRKVKRRANGGVNVILENVDAFDIECNDAFFTLIIKSDGKTFKKVYAIRSNYEE